MKNKIISALTVTFALFFLGFVVRISDDLSNAKKKLLDSPNIIDVTNDISTKILISKIPFQSNIEWPLIDYKDDDWKQIQIPSFQVVQEKDFQASSYVYYRIRIPRKTFKELKNLHNETSIALQYIFFSQIDVYINGIFYRTLKPKNSVEANVVLPVVEDQDNIIGLKAHIQNSDTGIDHRDSILLGSGVELNALHSLSYKVQTVFQLIFILCKGSILLIFALIYLLLKVESSFEKFFVFGLCAVIEELIAGEYLYGPLTFNQMVYLYNIVNFGGAASVFMFFAELNNMEFSKRILRTIGIFLLILSSLLAADSLYWNYFVDLTYFMKFWNMTFVGIMVFYLPKAFQKDKTLFFVLLISIGLYIWGALFAVNIGLNFKAYGNLLLFIMVAYQTFVIFKREQYQLQIHERKLLEQEKDVAIGKTASLLAHDIRKPMEQIRLVLDKLSSGEANKEFLHMAKKEIELTISGVDQQINDIMNISKTVEIKLVEISLYQILSHSLKQVMSVHQEMNIDVEYDFLGNNKIFGDQFRLQSSLVNLISNAVEAIRDIGNRFEGKIKFSTFFKEQSIILKIFNDGPEIPESIQKEIFKPLFSYGKPNGTGLGLASVLKTIHEHKGNIRVENLPGRGVEFTIELIKSPCTDNWGNYFFKNNSKDYSLDITSKEITDPPSFRIMILELDPNIINKIKKSLLGSNFRLQFEVVSNLEEAETLFKKSRFDFYLLNENLGGDNLKRQFPFLDDEILLYSNEPSLDLVNLIQRAFLNRVRVLFVDDTKLFRAAWMVFHGSHNITCVSSPEEALAIVNRKEKIDVFVLDYYFSNSSINGVALGVKIKNIFPQAVILISSSIDQQASEFYQIQKSDYDVRSFRNVRF